jgi:hypothetical protein
MRDDMVRRVIEGCGRHGMVLAPGVAEGDR